MATPMTTGLNPKLLLEGLNHIWGINYTDYDTEWSQIFEEATSNKNYEEDVALTGFDIAVKKPESSSIVYDTMKQFYTSRYTHTVYALGYEITREEMDDVLYPEFGRDRTIALARSMRQVQEITGANILNNAFDTSGNYDGGDGEHLCSLTHPIQGGTFSNRAAVDVDLSENSLEQAVIDIAAFRDNRNLRMKVMPRKVIVSYQNMFEIKRILGNPLRPDTSDRDINAIYAYDSFPEGVLISHYMTDADAFFVLTDAMKGLRHFTRTPARFENDNDFNTKNGLFSGYYRDSFGWTDPRGIWGSAGA